VNAFPSRSHAIQPTTWIAAGERAAFEAAGTNAHRLASGSEGWVERLGDDAMISHKNDAVLNELADGLEAWSAQAKWTPGASLHALPAIEKS
jgi:23S rRNA (cytosine1962-C5)-methyltransferase